MIDFEKGIKSIKKVFSLKYRADDMDFDVDIIGNSEKDCRDQLVNWLNGKSTVRIRKLENDTSVNVNTAENITPAAIAIASVEADNGVSVKPKSGRGAHFVGTTWIINHTLKDKKRVSADEVDGYLAKGYVKAGPRSSFKN